MQIFIGFRLAQAELQPVISLRRIVLEVTQEKQQLGLGRRQFAFLSASRLATARFAASRDLGGGGQRLRKGEEQQVEFRHGQTGDGKKGRGFGFQFVVGQHRAKLTNRRPIVKEPLHFQLLLFGIRSFECENLDAVVADLKSKGIKFDADPQDQPWLWREAYLRDPDDNVICLYHAGHNRQNPPWRINRPAPTSDPII